VVVTVNGAATDGVTFTVVPGTGTTILTDSIVGHPSTTYSHQNLGGRNFMTSIAAPGAQAAAAGATPR
jgi:hypothetical protein